jgi:hypothetical protein
MDTQAFKNEFRESVVTHLDKGRWTVLVDQKFGGFRPCLVLEDSGGEKLVVALKINEHLHFASLAFMDRVIEEYLPSNGHGVVVTSDPQTDSMRAIAAEVGVELVEVHGTPEFAAQTFLQFLDSTSSHGAR